MSLQPQQVTLSATGQSTTIPVDLKTFKFGVGLLVTVSSGASLNYTVLVSGDSLRSPAGNWNNHDVLQNKTTSANSSLAYPCTMVALLVNSYTSGSVTLSVVQVRA